MDTTLQVGIVGPIAVGKTTLVGELSKVTGWDIVPEPVIDNPYLPKFYADHSNWALLMQLHILSVRSQAHRAALSRDASAFHDRTVYEDAVFARVCHDNGFIDDPGYELYLRAYDTLVPPLKKHDVLVYLDASSATTHDRMLKRGMDYEKAVPIEYLEALRGGYEDMVSKISATIPVMRLDWEHPISALEVVGRIGDALGRKIPSRPT